jgi:hypothetical protein
MASPYRRGMSLRHEPASFPFSSLSNGGDGVPSCTSDFELHDGSLQLPPLPPDTPKCCCCSFGDSLARGTVGLVGENLVAVGEPGTGNEKLDRDGVLSADGDVSPDPELASVRRNSTHSLENDCTAIADQRELSATDESEKLGVMECRGSPQSRQFSPTRPLP